MVFAGECIVKPLNSSFPVKGRVGEILSLYPKGVPCHTSLFKGVKNSITTRFAEIEIGKCRKECDKGKIKKSKNKTCNIKYLKYCELRRFAHSKFQILTNQ